MSVIVAVGIGKDCKADSLNVYLDTSFLYRSSKGAFLITSVARYSFGRERQEVTVSRPGYGGASHLLITGIGTLTDGADVVIG